MSIDWIGWDDDEPEDDEPEDDDFFP